MAENSIFPCRFWQAPQEDDAGRADFLAAVLGACLADIPRACGRAEVWPRPVALGPLEAGLRQTARLDAKPAARRQVKTRRR